MARVLIIDDDQMICDMLSEEVRDLGHETACALTLKSGYEKARTGRFDVVFLDVRLPDGNGLDILGGIRTCPTAPEVIIMTGAGDPDGAEIAIRNGAWDYIEKPSSISAMLLPLVRALQYREAEKDKTHPVLLKRGGIVGSSARIEACLDLLSQAAASDVNVLITGETGTGKELFARAIHQNSNRSDRPFVVVDCAALPQTLVESVLFGYEKGAYTGADRAHEGLIRQADGGTLFLDEVGELPTAVQRIFLRTLQEHTFRPLGGKQEIKSDFRLVAATNRNLRKMADDGAFRDDLLFRLSAMPLEIPPLREHKEDIRELTLFCLARLCDRYGTDMKGFAPEFLEALLAHDWPGNVRELLNSVERAFAMASGDPILYSKHLSPEIRIRAATAAMREKRAPAMADAPSLGDLGTWNHFRKTMDQRYLTRLMHVAGGDVNKACQMSGLSRSRLYALLKTHQLLKSI